MTSGVNLIDVELALQTAGHPNSSSSSQEEEVKSLNEEPNSNDSNISSNITLHLPSTKTETLGYCNLTSDIKPIRVRQSQRSCPSFISNFLQSFEVFRWKINLLLLYHPFANYIKYALIARITVSDIIFLVLLLIAQLLQFMKLKDEINEIDDKWLTVRAVSIHFAADSLLTYSIAILFAQRNTLLNIFFGVPFERAICYHQWLSKLALVKTQIHFWCMIAYWTHNNEAGEQLQVQQNIAGLIGFFCLEIMATLGLEWFRRRFWELFLKAHISLFIIFLWTINKHNEKIFANSFFRFVFALWIIDLVWRAYITFSCNTRAIIKEMRFVDESRDIIYLEFEKSNFVYDGGQYAFICIPAIDITEWHPYSISSVMSDGKNHFHIKVSGDWCERLKYLIENNKSHDWKRIQIYVEGPYGRPEIPVHMYQSLIFIAGGIGITPLLSIFKDIMAEVRSGSKSLLNNMRRIHFVWAFRDPGIISEFDDQYRMAILKCGSVDSSGGECTADDVNRLVFNYKKFNLNVEIDGNTDGGNGGSELQSVGIEIQTSYYCSRLKGDDERQRELLKFYPEMRFQRPDVNAIMEIGKESIGGGCIGVLGCGPMPMIDDIRDCAAQHQIHCHTEVFNF